MKKLESEKELRRENQALRRETRLLETLRRVGTDLAAELDRARLLEGFERAERRVAVGGLGLGLYIAQQIMRAHGGRTRLDSALGRGARFTLELRPGRLSESAPLESAQASQA